MQLFRTTTRLRSRAAIALGGALVAVAAGTLAPTTAAAAPGSAAEASELMEQTAQQLTVIDEQVHEAELAVAAQQEAAQAAAEAAAAAQARLATFEPQLRAIAQSGYTGKSRSRVAAFLTSESAAELVQQMTTLDMIAGHTNAIVAQVAAAQDEAEAAQAAADEAAGTAEAGLAELEQQKAEVEKKVEQYQADFARLSAAEQAAVTTALAGPALATPSLGQLSLDPGSAAAVVIQRALSKVGAPYVWGASGPNGFDCSGLTSYAYAAVNVSLPHSSRAQASRGVPVSRAELRPGDLVFFYSPISHVGIYIGNGMMVHARTFGQPVAVTTVDQGGYAGARRILG